MSLAFRLMNEGYDCWFVNSRGNKYSLDHEKGPEYCETPDFWNFTW
jgi:hypothetical protein